MLLPQELKKKAFTRAMRGYEPAEVDEFVDFLIEKYSEVYTQCDRYDKKLRLVAERISHIQSEEEAIKKLAVSTQKLCDNMTAEAEEQAKNKIDGANAEAEEIITDAREKAESALAALNRRSEEKIKFIERKSDELLLSVRTRCAGILNEFKKDIAAQKNSLATLKNITENFNKDIADSYRRQIVELEDNMPDLNIDLDSFNESKLLADIMNDIKNDAIKMADDEAYLPDENVSADLEKLKVGTYAGSAEPVKKDIPETEKSVHAENPDGDLGMTRTVPVQKPDKNPPDAGFKQQATEEFDIVKYKNESEKSAPAKPVDEITDNVNAGEDATYESDGYGYESDDSGGYDSYEEDDAEVEQPESDRRGGRKKGFLGLFKRDRSEKKNNKYNEDEYEETSDDFDDDEDDFDDDDDDDDDYYGLKSTDSRRTESSIFDD